jgi:hypothetical protein
MSKTISFDEKNNGWTSFWSYKPECMSRLNNGFFSFKNGQLYKHHSETSPRNRFYNENGDLVIYPSTLTFVFNQEPSDIKHFKTLSLESNTKYWNADLVTNLDSGHILNASFDSREGEHYAFIRRNSNSLLDLNHLSVQGIGVNTNVVSYTYTFVNVPSSISTEDTLCFINSSGQIVVIQKVISYTSTTITTATPITPVVVPIGAFMFIAQSPIAESNGIKGNHAQIKLTTTDSSNEQVLFAVNSEVFKSYQ